MTAPERIWAWHHKDAMLDNRQWADNPYARYRLPSTEYVRADLAAVQPVPDPNADAVKVKPHLRLSIARKIGMYGCAYDGPHDARAYTHKHQPGNQDAWRIGKAASDASKDRAGDHIDVGLSLLRHLNDAGFGVFALNKHDTQETTPDPRDAVIARLVEALGDAQYGLSWAVRYFKDQDVANDDPCPPCTRGLSATRAALAAAKEVHDA